MSTLVLTACGTDTSSPMSSSNTNAADTQAKTQIEKTVEKSPDGSLEVREITSTRVEYDGEH